ncbi:putative thiamine transporter SLC35F3 isoform X3 [Ailuropoda melanoleuca]|uniref:putative thiamine transporter SLC35F3 isoform X3 n=1 Tax=Ailuropoda melanoleuca TaxID=9646 RepID=UPI001494555A|nr:putative thiamine transporter SLC35F3 isoform X3 [Ailuropoda melanoleuca]
MKKHSARVAPLSACNSPVLTLTKVEGEERPRDSPGPAEAQAPAGAEAGGRTSPHCWRCSGAQLRKVFWGVAVVLCVCSSWAGATQLAKLTFRKFDAPFTLTWFATNWNFLFFPLYYVGHVCKSEEKQSVRQRYRECCRFFGDNGLTLKVFFTKAAPFGVLWTLTNYLYLHAIKKVNTTDVSVLFCCNKAFVFLLSWIVLRDRFMGVRIVAAILAIAGIVMMTYADGFHSHSVIGIALVVGSASMSALYKVLFKLLLGSAKFGEAALFLSILGVFNILFITCIPVILYFTKVEYWSSFDDIPWGNLCGFSVLLLTFNIVLNFGIAVTYPTLMSVGIVLSVPVNAGKLVWLPLSACKHTHTPPHTHTHTPKHMHSHAVLLCQLWKACLPFCVERKHLGRMLARVTDTVFLQNAPVFTDHAKAQTVSSHLSSNWCGNYR